MTPSLLQSVPRSLRLLMVAGLCAAAVPAFAQSAEYRRGYDDGYRAGIAGGQQGGRPPGGDGGDARIAILRATYGRGNAVCDARGAVQNIVDQQGPARFEVSNDLCGDPASNQAKVLDVTYQCGRRGAAVRTTAEEGRTMRIACR